ncbi:putative glutathione-dependent formaldehyde-activating, GFA [Trichinella spiralis]|nr:putative glutathione-dependent formaldehyde-activating, GFA [Trichinella spiralis]
MKKEFQKIGWKWMRCLARDRLVWSILILLAMTTCVNCQDTLFESGKPFQFLCPPNQAVAGMSWKRVHVPDEDSDDLSISIHCHNLVDLPGRSPIVNEDDCYNGEFFSLSENSNTKSNSHCRESEFINGVSGVFEDGERLFGKKIVRNLFRIRFKCCKAKSMRFDSDFSCHSTQKYNLRELNFGAFRNSRADRSNCPKSVLTGLTVHGGFLSASFCPLAVKNYDYPLCELWKFEYIYFQFASIFFSCEDCLSDYNNGNASRAYSNRNNRQPKRLAVDSWPTTAENEFTLPGRNFKMQCGNGRAIRSITIADAIVPETNRSDVVFKIQCGDIFSNSQASVQLQLKLFNIAYRRRISRFILVGTEDASMANCHGDEFLKGLWSEYKLSVRTLAYVCEEGANIRAKWRPFEIHGRLFRYSSGGRVFGAKKFNQFMKSFKMSEQFWDSVFISAEFDTFYSSVKTKFETSETLLQYENTKFIAVTNAEQLRAMQRSNSYRRYYYY